MTSNKDFKALIEARKAGRVRPGVPQTDPAEVVFSEGTNQPVLDEPAGTATEETANPSQPSVPTSQRASTPAAAKQKSEVIHDPRLTAVRKTKPLVALNSYAYSDRKVQLKLEALSTGREMWEIVEDALEEYFEARYGKPENANSA